MFEITIGSYRFLTRGPTLPTPPNTFAALGQLSDWKHDEVPLRLSTAVRLTWGGLLPILDGLLLQEHTTGNGFVNRLTSQQLSEIRVKYQGEETECKVLVLRDVLEFLAERWMLDLELMYGPSDPRGLLDAVLKVLEDYPNQPVTLSSSKNKVLRQVPAKYRIGVKCNMLTNTVAYVSSFANGTRRSINSVEFHGNIDELTEGPIARLRKKRIKVQAAVVGPELFPWCFQNGVNPVTPDPEALFEYLSAQVLRGAEGVQPPNQPPSS